MTRKELFESSQPTWVVALTKENLTEPLTGAAGLVDMYLNFLITKTIANKKLALDKGEKTMFASNGLLPANEIIVLGCGESLSNTNAKALGQELKNTLGEMGCGEALVILPSNLTKETRHEIEKAQTSSESSKQAKIVFA